MADIELTSPAFGDHAPIPPRHTGDGEDVSPPLVWSGVPAEAAELVLMCEDPDAPSGTFLHWLVTGIAPDSAGVETGATPPGGTAHDNGFGRRGWGGPQPPKGDPPHRYLIRLFALRHPLALPKGAGADDVHRAVAGRHLADGTLMGLYQR